MSSANRMTKLGFGFAEHAMKVETSELNIAGYPLSVGRALTVFRINYRG
tara:strand:+ start:1040 stop:1186 length:147 start_codon:yes stop_codon:yes gene_type:complete